MSVLREREEAQSAPYWNDQRDHRAKGIVAMKCGPRLGGGCWPRRAILEVVLVLLLTIVGGWLRFQGLSRDSLWFDEAQSFLQARLPLWQLLQRVARNVHPPLYYLLLRGVMIFGDSESVLRWPSAFFGTLSIPFLYLLGRAWFSGSVGVVAALLLTLSPVHLWHSQDAKMYTLLTFEGILGWYVFGRLLEEEVPRRATWIGYGLVAGAILFTHYYGALFLLSQAGLVALLRLRGEVERSFWWRWLGVQVGLALFLILWLAFAWPTLRLKPVEWIAEEGRHSLVRLAEGLLGFSAGYAPYKWLLGLPVLALALTALLRDERRGWRTLGAALREWAILRCLAYFAVPIAIMVAISLVRPLMVSRHMLMTAPGYFLLVAVGLSRLLRNRLLTLGAAGLVLFLLPGVIHRVSKPRTPDHRAATTVVLANATAGDLVLLSPPERSRILEYYVRGPTPMFRMCLGLSSDASPEQVERCLRDARRVWVMFSSSATRLKDPTFLALLTEQFRPVRSEEFFRLRLALYERAG